MYKIKVLVTGASGQVGQALQYIAPQYEQVEFIFANSANGDICDIDKLRYIFSQNSPDFCINAAAYTTVDKAENEPEAAHEINVAGSANVARVCKEFDTVLLHISTDFVFDGHKTQPYTEEDEPNPKNVYGQTKREGELAIIKELDKYYIIRTSWVYSQFGNNFMKTMLKIAKERDSLRIVSDQKGSPTHAVDLAKALLAIILSGKQEYGIYNFSNEGEASWYDFAQKIFEVNNVAIAITPVPTSEYPTPAERPKYSVLSKNKIKSIFGIEIDHWNVPLKLSASGNLDTL